MVKERTHFYPYIGMVYSLRYTRLLSKSCNLFDRGYKFKDWQLQNQAMFVMGVQLGD